jgi:hypothetical protein
MPNWADVVEIGGRLPGVEESTWWGTPGLKVAGKGFCRVRTDPDALVIRVLDLGDREALMRGQPDVFFITPHYKGFPYVLVRLELIGEAELGEMVEDAWRINAPRRLVREYDATIGTDAGR